MATSHIPRDTQTRSDSADPTALAKLPALIGQVFLRGRFGANVLTVWEIILAALLIKVAIWIGEFGDQSAGWVLPALLWAFLAAAIGQRVLIWVRQQLGDPVDPASPGVAFLTIPVALVQRFAPNPHWAVARVLEQPVWLVARFLEPLAFAALSYVSFRINEVDGGRVLLLVALAQFLYADGAPLPMEVKGIDVTDIRQHLTHLGRQLVFRRREASARSDGDDLLA